MRTFAIMYRPKNCKVYTLVYEKAQSGATIAVIHGSLGHSLEHKAKLANENPENDYAVFELVEVAQ